MRNKGTQLRPWLCFGSDIDTGVYLDGAGMLRWAFRGTSYPFEEWAAKCVGYGYLDEFAVALLRAVLGHKSPTPNIIHDAGNTPVAPLVFDNCNCGILKYQFYSSHAPSCPASKGRVTATVVTASHCTKNTWCLLVGPHEDQCIGYLHPSDKAPVIKVDGGPVKIDTSKRCSKEERSSIKNAQLVKVDTPLSHRCTVNGCLRYVRHEGNCVYDYSKQCSKEEWCSKYDGHPDHCRDNDEHML